MSSPDVKIPRSDFSDLEGKIAPTIDLEHPYQLHNMGTDSFIALQSKAASKLSDAGLQASLISR